MVEDLEALELLDLGVAGVRTVELLLDQLANLVVLRQAGDVLGQLVADLVEIVTRRRYGAGQAKSPS